MLLPRRKPLGSLGRRNRPPVMSAQYHAMHVLVVHSDPRFYREIQPLLAAQQASGAYQSSLSGIRHQVEAHFPDLIILEQGCLAEDVCPLGDAFAHFVRLPVIFLTTADGERIRAGEERTRLSGLLGHLRSQGERSKSTQVVQIGQLRIHAGRMRVALNDRWVRLPPIQFRILQHLAANVNELVAHGELMSVVWGYAATDEEARELLDEKARELLKVHIRQLRRALGPEFKGYIQAVRGQGYVLVDPSAEDS